MHQVLQAAFDWEDAHLHRFTADDPFAPLPPAYGVRRGPLEGSGGLPGYGEVLDALADPSHHDHSERSAWEADVTGSHAPFDPALLALPAVNRALDKMVLQMARSEACAVVSGAH
ncbi:plasmid pRiA4b ORF-3 family protein [Pseudarthrobacter sp. NamE2]|uniref:plasmid pRiA4b ORF-3 family protein n=1 Tax=Pseudarthrobacter sp. NamE2 TaxID=2576838 RepID=UPI001F0D63DD|nr:plasmid pRiA4b ORF-3 family protein [Pseudarthrobacter sp. NamE2]